MINFIAANDGKLEMYDCSTLVVASNDVNTLVDAAIKNGGFANAVYASSSCHFAEEYGFESQFKFDKIWDDVCGLM
jgi:hypothetical protein